MSLDNNMDPFQGYDPYHYFGATGGGYGGQQQGSQGGTADPAWSTDPFGSSSNYGYNPSQSQVGATNLQAYSPYDPNSAAGGANPTNPLYPNVYGTNEYSATNPFATSSSASPTTTQAANNQYSSNPNTASASTPPGPGSPGYTGGTTGTNPALGTGGSGTGSTGSTGSGTGTGTGNTGDYNYQSFWSPEYAYNGWQRALADQGINTLSGTPASQIASNDYYRAYGNWLLNAMSGNAPANDVNQSFHNWAASGGNGGAGIGSPQIFQTMMNSLHNQQNGTMSANDPMAPLLLGLQNNPQLATQVFAALGPRTAGSRYMPQYLQALASHNAVTNTNTVRNPLEALLMSFGAV